MKKKVLIWVLAAVLVLSMAGCAAGAVSSNDKYVGMEPVAAAEAAAAETKDTTSISDLIRVPFGYLLDWLYTFTNSYGLALILFSLIVKLVLLPMSVKSKKSMLRMGRMNSKVQEIQKKYANNKERQQQEIADLYAREGVNPMSGCLWSFLPFPILIALYYIIRTPLRYFMSLSNEVIAKITELAVSLGYVSGASGQASAYDQIYLAKFIHDNWSSFEGKFDGLIDLNYTFLSMDLSAVPKDLFSQFPSGGWPVIGIMLMPLISAALQFLMTRISMKTNGNSNMNGSSKAMLYMMPLMTVWMGYILPAALCVYWIANAAFSCIQEQVLNKHFSKVLDREETDKERQKREARYAKMQAARENYNRQLEQQAQSKGGKKPQPQPKKKKTGESTTEAGKVGNRPYARGRAYREEHYDE